MMTPIQRNWTVTGWSRPEEVLAADGTLVLGHGNEPRIRYVRGAQIHDRDRGVAYRVTIGRSPGRVWLRTVEVEPDEDRPVDAAILGAVPAQRLADATAQFLAEQDKLSSTELRLDLREHPVVDLPNDPPTPERVADLHRSGETRRTMASLFNVTVWRIDQVVREARKQGLIPPAATQKKGKKK